MVLVFYDITQIWVFLLTLWPCLYISKLTCGSLRRAWDFLEDQSRKFYMQYRPYDHMAESSCNHIFYCLVTANMMKVLYLHFFNMERSRQYCPLCGFHLSWFCIIVLRQGMFSNLLLWETSESLFKIIDHLT